jgi:toxin FitB
VGGFVSFLLDTCVLSELRRPRPDAAVIQWFEDAAEDSLFVSIVTLAEISRGIEKARVINPVHAEHLDAWFAQLKLRFKSRTVDADRAVWDAWAEICGISDAIGTPRPPIDALLTATAHLHQLTIVTRNMRDFAPYPLLHNPWTAAA